MCHACRVTRALAVRGFADILRAAEDTDMTTEIKLPKLSDTMEEGTLLRWLKREGDDVRVGDVIAEVETDKADMELEAEAAGTLSEIRVQEGDSVAVGAVLAVLADASQGKPPVETATTAEPEAVTSPAAAAPPPRSVKATVPPTAKPRIVLPPSSAAPDEKPAAVAPATNKPTAAKAVAPERVAKLRAAVAKQMIASKRDIPHFYVTCEIDMSEAARLRKSLSETPGFPERLTFTHLLLRALAVTLPRHPRLNASWVEDGLIVHDAVHLGIAVAVDDGLIAPVLRDCQERSLRNLARAVTELVGKVQSGRSDKLTGATFTLSNLGMLDVESFTAVIIPPQSAILAVGAIKDRAVVRDGTLAVAKTMRATVSADHRVSTGYEAGLFLQDLKHVLENPALLLLADEPTPGES